MMICQEFFIIFATVLFPLCEEYTFWGKKECLENLQTPESMVKASSGLQDDRGVSSF